jgi:hypothetical protein
MPRTSKISSSVRDATISPGVSFVRAQRLLPPQPPCNPISHSHSPSVVLLPLRSRMTPRKRPRWLSE